MALYLRAPVWMQNVLLSGYGRLLRRRRYGGVHRRHLAWLMETQWLPAEDLQRLQVDRLNRQIAIARAAVPLYRDRGLPEREIESLDDLRDLPLLRKDDLRRPRAELVAEAQRRGKPVEIHTGGTTGKPLVIHCDAPTLQRNYAFFERLKRWAGVPADARVATFAGRTVVPPDQTAPPFWRRNRAARTTLFSSYHLSEASLPAYAAELRALQPALIDSYPSSLEPIARHLLANGIDDIRPTAVITSSETLTPAVREVVEAAFGCRVFDHYGAAEMAALVTQCERGRYHPNPEFGVLEVLADGEPAPPGERGEIVATGFVNPVLPLIRYVTGDTAVAGGERCPCGRAFPVLEAIEGRRDDVLVTPEGRRIGRLDPIFKSVSSFYETRIVQTAADHVRVEVVPASTYDPHDEARLLEELRRRIGPSMAVELVQVESLPRTASGKLRAVVNEVSRPTAPDPGIGSLPSHG